MRIHLTGILLTLVFSVLPGASAFASVGGVLKKMGSDTFAVSKDEESEWEKFDGQVVEAIEIEGLKRTRRETIEWIIGTKRSALFSAKVLAADLQRLYNTGNLYDLEGTVQNGRAGQAVVKIVLKDKWTLFPAIGAQGGGGSTTIGGGIFESNFLGYMTNASLMLWAFNGTTSYDLNFNQEYFYGTQTMWSIDVKDSIEPQFVHGYDGSSLGEFAWRRRQEEFMIGTHFNGPIRLMLYASIFQDSVFKNENGFNPSTAPGLQQRFAPKIIVGRSDWTDYLEDGTEFTFQPAVSNIIGSGPKYGSFEIDFKKVWLVGSSGRDNAAVYLSTTHMEESGPNYLCQVGGYYNVRGYADLREFGRHVAVANFEYRPFLFGYRWKLVDADLMAVQAAFFSDVGSAWGNASLTGEKRADEIRPLWSAGAGLRINMVKFAGAILRLDVARTISPDEGTGFSFGVGQFF